MVVVSRVPLRTSVAVPLATLDRADEVVRRDRVHVVRELGGEDTRAVAARGSPGRENAGQPDDQQSAWDSHSDDCNDL